MKTELFLTLALEPEKAIAENFSKIRDIVNGDSTPTTWTNAVNLTLYNTAKQINSAYYTASKFRQCENKEWLYDFVWYENNEKGLKNVHLVVECEWKNPWGNVDYGYDIQYDFEKLILARSKYRLMIFESDDQNECAPYLENLKQIISKSELTEKDDRYMFAVWNKLKQEFDFDLFIAD